jgi:hypothetical protein
VPAAARAACVAARRAEHVLPTAADGDVLDFSIEVVQSGEDHFNSLPYI